MSGKNFLFLDSYVVTSYRACQLAQALSYLQSVGLVHGNISPENVSMILSRCR